MKNTECTFGHQVGEEFIFDEYGVDKKLCIYAQAALFPAINILLHGGNFSWLTDGAELFWGCPHPGSQYTKLGQVIFKLELLDI